MTTTNNTLSVRDQASLRRIEFEKNQIEVKTARLAQLKEGTPGYKRCKQSLDLTVAFVAKLEAGLAQRQEKRAEREAIEAAKPRKVFTPAPVQFDGNMVANVSLVEEPANDQVNCLADVG